MLKFKFYHLLVYQFNLHTIYWNYMFFRFKWVNLNFFTSKDKRYANNIIVGLPVWILRPQSWYRWQLEMQLKWLIAREGYWVLNRYNYYYSGYYASSFIIRASYAINTRTTLFRLLWRRYKWHRYGNANSLYHSGAGRATQWTYIKYRQLTYLKRTRRELQYILGVFLNVQRFGRFIKNFKRDQGGRFGSYRLEGYNLRSILKIINLGGHWCEIDELIEKGGIYVNGCACPDPFYKPRIGDRIQLIVASTNFFRCHRLYASARRRALLIRSNRWRQTRHYYFYLVRKLPWRSRWFFRNIHDRLDIPKYLEFDNSTQTIIILYHPYLISHFSGFFLNIIHWNFWNIYNWRLNY